MVVPFSWEAVMFLPGTVFLKRVSRSVCHAMLVSSRVTPVELKINESCGERNEKRLQCNCICTGDTCI